MSRNKTLSTLAMIFVAGVLVPAIGQAQTTDSAAAEKLEQRVDQPFDIGQLARMGDLLVKAAGLRSDTDPVGVGDLLRAGGAYYSGGKPQRARETFEQAADRALAMGDVSNAANAYVWAAIIANQQHDPGRDVLIAKANRLSASPLLSEGERQAIVGHFKQAVQVATH